MSEDARPYQTPRAQMAGLLSDLMMALSRDNYGAVTVAAMRLMNADPSHGDLYKLCALAQLVYGARILSRRHRDGLAAVQARVEEMLEIELEGLLLAEVAS